jgi:outer membrane lipoprotein-sorting protein
LKKASMLLLCVIALLAILVVVDVPYTNRQAKMDSSSNKNVSSNFTSIAPSSQETQTITATASQQDSDLYIVKEYKGHIGGISRGGQAPV